MDKKESLSSKGDYCGSQPTPSAPLASQGNEEPVLSNLESPPYQTRPAVPPKYVLDPEYLKTNVGESPKLKFAVTSEPPLASDSEHSLIHHDGKLATKRFKVHQDVIEFREVRVSDTDFYTISCSNAAGLEGKATFELEVFEVEKSPAQSTQNVAVVTHQPTTVSPPVIVNNDKTPDLKRLKISQTDIGNNDETPDLKRLKIYMILWIIVFTILAIFGVFFLWALPCWVGVIACVQLAARNMGNTQYAGARSNFRVSSYCLIAWLITSAIGTIIIIPTLAVTLT